MSLAGLADWSGDAADGAIDIPTHPGLEFEGFGVAPGQQIPYSGSAHDNQATAYLALKTANSNGIWGYLASN